MRPKNIWDNLEKKSKTNVERLMQSFATSINPLQIRENFRLPFTRFSGSRAFCKWPVKPRDAGEREAFEDLVETRPTGKKSIISWVFEEAFTSDHQKSRTLCKIENLTRGDGRSNSSKKQPILTAAKAFRGGLLWYRKRCLLNLLFQYYGH